MESTSPDPSPPLRILSLDGGGIRGISSLLILEHLMEEMRKAQGLEHVPRPCECFDFIGGTSTGGIIAIMLGRLQMTVDECIREYREVAQKAFTPKRTTIFLASPKGAFSATALEEAVQNTSRKFCIATDCADQRRRGIATDRACPHRDLELRDPGCTKTAVLAITKDNVDAPPTLFTTYDTSEGFRGCSIWEVARATSAATTFFKPIRVGRDEIEFVDAGFGYNNPCEVLVDEARKQFPSHTRLQVLSIGTGLGDVVSIGKTRMDIVRALKSMATSSKKVAARMDHQYGDSHQYFRFNVDKGLEDVTLSDWEKSSTISAHTRNYIDENWRAIAHFVGHFTSRFVAQPGPVLAEVGGRPVTQTSNEPLNRVAHQKTHFIVPFGRNENFVGRDAIITQLLERIPPGVYKDTCQRTAVVGLGGIGKTQVAIEAAYRVRDAHPQCSVFWVPAVDISMFENACREIGRALNIRGIDDDDQADVKSLVKTALERDDVGNWLLIVDNADDMNLLFTSSKLAVYLPSSRNGSVLLTTRNHKAAARWSRGQPVRLQEMDTIEATALLRKDLNESQFGDSQSTAQLLEYLTYLPLAIRQASAYLAANTNVTVARYLEYCKSSNGTLVKLLSRDFDDQDRYESIRNPVATTWLISFEHISRDSPLAAEYLGFICYLADRDIPRDLLPPGKDEMDTDEAIGTLKAYAFVLQRGDANSFDIHRLVRLVMRNWLRDQGKQGDRVTGTIQRLSEMLPRPDHGNREIWMAYLPHAQAAVEVRDWCTDDEASWGLLSGTGECYDLLGKYREAEKMHRQTLELKEKVLGSENPSTLDSMNNLALVLRSQGKYHEAEQMHRQTLALREKVLEPESPSTLSSMNNLALVLESQGKYDEAEQMHRRTLEL
ncbi:acyl transferase/acyl hydrolase/lysophospholipase, partial [Colletotrichum cereale]